jgi:general secretion pathway protein E
MQVTPYSTTADNHRNRDTASVIRILLEQDASPAHALDTLVRYAAHRNGTDLFCCAQRDHYVLSIRCDWIVQDLVVVPTEWAKRFIGHAKVEALLDPAIHRHPQDGHLVIDDEGHPIDVRVGTLPTFQGEDMALRILDSRYRLLSLGKLGVSEHAMGKLESLINHQFGLVLVTGPTGSGKTTTLYAILNALNDGTRKINTIEDPVECYIAGTHQSQINRRIGFDFAELLPEVLRQNPDIIMIGEIRDPETARIALRAAVTGQLVFATLHAPTAATAVHRMLALGANPHLLASSLRGVIAQNIVRRICPGCTAPVSESAMTVDFDDIADLLRPGETPTAMRGRGCETCSQTGYDGLTGVHEVFECAHSIRPLIEREETPETIESQAVKDGMITLRAAAKLAVAQGITTMEEATGVMDP